VGVFDEGEVEVKSASGGEGVKVGAGQETMVGRRGPPQRPFALRRAAIHRQRMAAIRTRREALRAQWVKRTPEERRDLRQKFLERRINRLEKRPGPKNRIRENRLERRQNRIEKRRP
jgi:hypothetical protein